MSKLEEIIKREIRSLDNLRKCRDEKWIDGFGCIAAFYNGCSCTMMNYLQSLLDEANE